MAGWELVFVWWDDDEMISSSIIIIIIYYFVVAIIIIKFISTIRNDDVIISLAAVEGYPDVNDDVTQTAPDPLRL